ncbi:MAG: glycoside hydrolase family 10 protein [Bacillota bacterium]
MKLSLQNVFIAVLLITVCTFAQDADESNIPIKREFRGAWVATVANIDWPMDRNATPGAQIADLVSTMDKLKAAGINAVIFQVRTECDALYKSSIEPWSYWLTGHQGQAPEPFFDPLEFAIAEAHSRGMELHAWFNPYRAVKTTGEYELASNHVSAVHPDWILTFGSLKILDPGNPEVKTYILSIVSDVLRRYDIDGIHFDDYFYPYTPITNEDSLTFVKYKGSFTNIHDWRRNNINDLMAKIYDSVKVVKPRVKFGISPFGIVENKYAGTNGFSSYDILYCDPLTWIKNKSVDYINPQLYWEIGHARADYAKLLPWWASVSNTCQLYIGQYSSSMAAPGYKGSKTELEDQLRMNRSTKNVQGEVFFSSKSITQNFSGFADTLKNNFYKYPALPPLMSWKDAAAPLAPQDLKLKADSAGVTLEWVRAKKASDGEEAAYFVIYKFSDKESIDINDPRNILTIIPAGKNKFRDNFTASAGEKYTYVVTSLDRLYNESDNNPQVTTGGNL